jgi:RNA polymerase sigma-70 factor, ECF subfamily
MVDRRAEKIGRFYQEHRDALYGYALTLTGDRDRAEDAVHAAIEKLLARLLLPFDLKRYAYRCVRNAAVSAWRKDGARRDPLFDLSMLAANDPDRGRAERMDQVLAALSVDERETVILKVFDELSFKEIAAVRGVPLNTAASHYRRALDKLRTLCGEERP